MRWRAGWWSGARRALLTAGYAAAAGAAVAASGKNVNNQVQTELTKSFSSAADTAARYPPSVQDNIIAAAKEAFLQGDQWAYLAGIIAVLLGAALVWFKFPKRDEERQLLASYAAQDDDDECLDREKTADRRIEIKDRRQQGSGHSRERRTQSEADPGDAGDIHTDQLRRNAVLSRGANGQADIGAHEEQVQRGGEK